MNDGAETRRSSPVAPGTALNANIHSQSSWFAADPSKAYYEKLSLIWAPLSMVVLLAGVFGTSLYKYCDRNSYLVITVVGCLPGIFVPIFFPCKADRGRPYSQRFWVKGSVWIAIFGFYGNYFWTHYFYELLGAQYLFDSYRFNDVPLVTFTATFFYFTFYFSFVNILLRRISSFSQDLPTFARSLIWWSNVCALAYGTAVFEAVSIQHFPLYTYTEREAFLIVGSVVYGLYFVVGFPMFFALDENYQGSIAGRSHRISLRDSSINAFAATAIITLLLDLWRLVLGSIYEIGQTMSIRVPFIYQGKECSMPSSSQHVSMGFDDCMSRAAECAQEAASWAYKKAAFFADTFEKKTGEVTAPFDIASG